MLKPEALICPKPDGLYCPPGDFYIDPVRPVARAEIKKVGRRIANVHVEAWQDQRASPIAALRGHFLVKPLEEGTRG